MGSRFETADDHIRCVDANPDAITPPRDGAVFYTNRGRELAVDQAARKSGEGAAHVTLEGARGTGAHGTPMGAELDAQNLYDTSDPANRAMEDREIARIKRTQGGITLDKHPAADRVWDHASRRYAEQASGRVTVVANGKPIKEHSFFARVERPALIRNEQVTHVNGIERRELADLLDRAEAAPSPEARKQAMREINARIEAGDPSRDKAAEMDISRDGGKTVAGDDARRPEKPSALQRHRAARAAPGDGPAAEPKRRRRDLSKGSR